MLRYLEITVPKTAASASVMYFLRTEGSLTKKQISQAKFRPEGILRNGHRCRVTETAFPGDILSVCLETASVDSSVLTDSSSLFMPEILYEDRDLLAVNKPAGMVTHPSGIHYEDSLSNSIARYFRSKNEATRIRSIGRLDRETSGVLLFAKNQTAAARLQKQREQGTLKKTYLAFVSGSLPADPDGQIHYISIPLAPDPTSRLKMVLSPDMSLPGSKQAETFYTVLQSNQSSSLVQLTLKTGRTHQIRVHMAGIGHPLLGDSLYNLKDIGSHPFARAALHAEKLTFIQPFTQKEISLEAPLPEDFRLFLLPVRRLL